MMKIAIVVPTLAHGGAEKVASQLSKFMSSKSQMQVIVMKSDIEFDYSGTLVNMNVNTILERKVISRLINTIKITYKLYKLKKAESYGAVISFLELANIPNILSGSTRTLISVREHRLSSTQNDIQRKLTNLLIRLLYNRANKIVAVSRGIEQSLLSDFGIAPHKIRVIYNPIMTDNIETRMKQTLSQEMLQIYSCPVIATMGRLTVQKGQWHLIRSFKKVLQSVPNAKLVVLGEGELKDNLTSLVNKMGLAHAVYFLGFDSNPFKFIARARMFVLPSLWEGFPNALIEAMACGVPVISTDCNTGPREILAPDTDYHVRAGDIEYAQYGILVPVLDGEMRSEVEPLSREEDKLAFCMIKVLQDENLAKRYAFQVQVRARDFSSDSIMAKWDQVIHEVVLGTS
ncbi:MAG TPA: glycosyltransferase [Nitrospirota bacterium]|nr:glycosyltransferase [Nitrospirota bacterium]